MKTENDLYNNNPEIEVSVCCATYNHEKYIERTLQGFVSQITDFKFEVIVHEDASTDNTRQIVQRYVEEYPELFVPIYQSENQYSKRKGLVQHNMFAKARGKYIALCEGDDYWIDEHKLQKQYDVMEANEGCSVCVHKVKHVFEDDNQRNQSSSGMNLKSKYGICAGIVDQKKMADAIWLSGGYPFHTSSYFVRKSVVKDWISEKADFIPYMNGDMAMSRLALLYGDFFYMEERMSCRRHGVEGSWSEQWSSSVIQTKLKHYLQMVEGERLFDEYSEFKFHKYIQIHIFNLIAECCIHDDKDIRKYLKGNPVSIGIVHDKKTLVIFVRYLIMRMSPSLYQALYKCQRKRN